MSLIIDKDLNIIKVPNNNIKDLPENWKSALINIVNYIKLSFNESILSIFVRGSVAKGKPIDNLSDMDITIVFKYSFLEYKNIINEYKKFFLDKFNFIKDLDFSFSKNINNIFEEENLSFYIKYDSFCLFGEDLSFYIPNFKLTNKLCFYIKSLMTYDNYINNLNTLAFIKTVIRASFELCMVREKSYIRDIELCVPIFIKYYPDKKENIMIIYKIFQDNMYKKTNIYLNNKERTNILEFVKFIIEEYKQLK